MKFSRHNFLGSTSILLGSMLMAMLTIPLGRWTGTPALLAVTTATADEPSRVTFVDVAKEAGLNAPNVWGGIKHKKYIVEVKGSGLAFFDYDNNGWIDIYLTNGVRFEETYTPKSAPIQHLYKNNRDGTFTDVTEKAGLVRTGWGTSVSIGDYDNDSWTDVFHATGHVYPEIESYHLDAHFLAPHLVYRNLGNGKFKHVSKDMGPGVNALYSSRGCAFGDFDNDGDIDVLILNRLHAGTARAIRRSSAVLP